MPLGPFIHRGSEQAPSAVPSGDDSSPLVFSGSSCWSQPQLPATGPAWLLCVSRKHCASLPHLAAVRTKRDDSSRPLAVLEREATCVHSSLESTTKMRLSWASYCLPLCSPDCSQQSSKCLPCQELSHRTGGSLFLLLHSSVPQTAHNCDSAPEEEAPPFSPTLAAGASSSRAATTLR